MTNPYELWLAIDRRIQRAIQRVPTPMRGTLRSLVASGKALSAQVRARAGEDISDVEVVQHFGFTSSPPAGLDVIVVPLARSSASAVVVGEIDRSWRPTDLEAGETCIYAAVQGTVVRVKPSGTIEITAAADVILNGGTNGVARLGDAIAIDASSLSALNSSLTTAGGSSVVSLTGTITAASATVKAGG